MTNVGEDFENFVNQTNEIPEVRKRLQSLYEVGDFVEIERSDNQYNVGRTAKVLQVKEDALRVKVLDNGEEFWIDVDSVF
ncbi:hypothetical protein [Paenibacillus xylaniclasticus]|uniref:hypothetical protein n=1 Tax=Paenibacillus xylaniclasticus TaxID=588083 RepID=UPI000FD84DE0|nr:MULTISPECIES: hypothetical protein [Paenibacillus]GFN32502.1 hypothetical protein PCURB6_27620 [Paenibacillus curdlanolyticus]